MKVGKIGLVLGVLLFCLAPSYGALFGDYDGSGQVNLDDVVYLWAQVQLEAFSGSIPTVEQLKARAGALRSSVSRNLLSVPPLRIADLNLDTKLNLDDVAFLWGWYQLESFSAGSGSNASLVETRAKSLRSSVSGNLGVFPNITVPVTGTGSGTWNPEVPNIDTDI